MTINMYDLRIGDSIEFESDFILIHRICFYENVDNKTIFRINDDLYHFYEDGKSLRTQERIQKIVKKPKLSAMEAIEQGKLEEYKIQNDEIIFVIDIYRNTDIYKHRTINNFIIRYIKLEDKESFLKNEIFLAYLENANNLLEYLGEDS